MKIVSRYDCSKVIFEADAESVLDLVGKANAARADLAGADLAGANLYGADLYGANLEGAYLARAYLAGANLAGADLYGANLEGANLEGAYLARARGLATTPTSNPPEPYVRPASMSRRAYAERYRQRHPEVPVVERLDSRILAAIAQPGCSLDMSDWHTCDTTHCRAGWAVHLAGEAGYALEKEHGPRIAGAMIYRASTGRAPHFFAPNDRALEDIKRCAAAEDQAEGEVAP